MRRRRCTSRNARKAQRADKYWLHRRVSLFPVGKLQFSPHSRRDNFLSAFCVINYDQACETICAPVFRENRLPIILIRPIIIASTSEQCSNERRGMYAYFRRRITIYGLSNATNVNKCSVSSRLFTQNGKRTVGYLKRYSVWHDNFVWIHFFPSFDCVGSQ